MEDIPRILTDPLSEDGSGDRYPMGVCPLIVTRGPGAEGGFTLFGANQGA